MGTIYAYVLQTLNLGVASLYLSVYSEEDVNDTNMTVCIRDLYTQGCITGGRVQTREEDNILHSAVRRFIGLKKEKKKTRKKMLQ